MAFHFITHSMREKSHPMGESKTIIEETEKSSSKSTRPPLRRKGAKGGGEFNFRF